MKEDKAKKLLRDTISRYVNQILKYPYGFTYHWHYAGTEVVMTVIPCDKRKFYQVYLIYHEGGIPERTYGTVRVSRHVLKCLLIKYYKKATSFNQFMYQMEHGSTKVRQDSLRYFTVTYNNMCHRMLRNFSIRKHPVLERPLKDLFKVNITINDLEMVMKEI